MDAVGHCVHFMYLNVLLACMSVYHMHAWCLELELQMVVSSLMWVLEIELPSSGRAVHALNH